ncbi:hypothetical protein [Salipiger abyssi]|uniref:Uncharacterized protein n=1 Tax=Salipiger abyssi TaxID=1250539 RepID=A0A1P8UUQ7_9RHOB|nr:hypothetical protein [Salipiger abyssi]APZ53098.1 hypothetical protein Ga0080574_TMP2764 [Salipiger abyssi]
MSQDAKRVTLKRDGRVLVDGADTGWKWHKSSGFHPEYKLRGATEILRHYKLKTFKLKVLDFHNGTGAYA